MDPVIQWAVTSVIAIIAIFAGRMWERYDHRLKKDRDILEKILKIIPVGSETYLFLSQHDFGNAFRREPLLPLRELELLLSQPSNFFLNKKLEKKKKDLCHVITEFLELIAMMTFRHDVLPDFYGLPSPP